MINRSPCSAARHYAVRCLGRYRTPGAGWGLGYRAGDMGCFGGRARAVPYGEQLTCERRTSAADQPGLKSMPARRSAIEMVDTLLGTRRTRLLSRLSCSCDRLSDEAEYRRAVQAVTAGGADSFVDDADRCIGWAFGWHREHPGAASASRLNEAVTFQLSVCACDGVRRNAEIASKLADRGQSMLDWNLACSDRCDDLRLDLFERRRLAGGVDVDLHHTSTGGSGRGTDGKAPVNNAKRGMVVRVRIAPPNAPKPQMNTQRVMSQDMDEL